MCFIGLNILCFDAFLNKKMIKINIYRKIKIKEKNKNEKKRNLNVFMLSQVLLVGLPLVVGQVEIQLERN